jgi:hypothetical protein
MSTKVDLTGAGSTFNGTLPLSRQKIEMAGRSQKASPLVASSPPEVDLDTYMPPP